MWQLGGESKLKNLLEILKVNNLLISSIIKILNLKQTLIKSILLKQTLIKSLQNNNPKLYKIVSKKQNRDEFKISLSKENKFNYLFLSIDKWSNLMKISFRMK
jgi:hypothetical protein